MSIIDDLLHNMQPVSPFGSVFVRPQSPVRSYEVYTEEETGDVCLEAELPGFEAENVKIETDGGELRIDASCTGGRQERAFKKTFALGDLDPKKIFASMKNGILKIRLSAKKAKKSDVKTIAVST